MMRTQSQGGSLEVVVTPAGVDPSRTDVSTEGGATCTYEPHSGSYRARFEGESPPPSDAIVDVLAAIEATDPVDLPPLFEVVDPEALDALLSSAGADDGSLCVTFEYQDNDVTVTA